MRGVAREQCGTARPLRRGVESCYEIVAGARRLTAARIVADERRAAGEDLDPHDLALPCAILDPGDDADAVEASLIENMARRDADEVTQWATFTRLVKEGRSVSDIAATFGLPDLTVKRILALGNLLPRIRTLYANEEIDAATVRHLTLASKARQRDWLALLDDPEVHAPTGQRLKAWLLGGQSIPVRHAVFDVPASGLVTVADLFGEDALFADAEAFWIAQDAAIAGLCEGFRDAGWTDAVVVPPSEHFASWEYEKTPKRKGGKVFLDVRASGEVVVHEGYLTRKEATRKARAPEDGKGDAGDAKPTRPELTGPLTTYLDLHRHAAVRAELVTRPGVALRLLVAHAVAGSALFRVSPDPQTTRDEATRESLDNSLGEAVFDASRRAVLALLGFEEDAPTVIGGCGPTWGAEGPLIELFQRLLDLPDSAALDVAAVVMGEALAVGSACVAAVGQRLEVDMARWWQADDAFFALLREREVLTRIVGEVAGEPVAAANATEKTATLKGVVRDSLLGANGRAKVEGWVPRWLAFPASAYTERGGVGMVAASEVVDAATADAVRAEPDNGSVQGDAPLSLAA